MDNLHMVVIVTMPTLSTEDCDLDPQSGQTKYYKIVFAACP